MSDEPTKITVGLIAVWLLGLLVGLIGISDILGNPLQAVPFLLAAALLIPPVYTEIAGKFKIVMSTGVRVLSIIALLVIGGVFDNSRNAAPREVTPTPTPSTSQEVTPKISVVPSTPKATPKPTQVPAPTPTKTPAPAPVTKSYQQIFTFSGNGTKKSEPFTTTGSRFKIRYTCDGSYCGAFLYYANGSMKDLIMNSTGSVSDETIIYGAGTYYIDANTIGNFTMIVEDYR